MDNGKELICYFIKAPTERGFIRIISEREHTDFFLKLGFCMTPVEAQMEDELEEMTKEELEVFAKENFGVDIDLRVKKEKLIDQIRELLNG